MKKVGLAMAGALVLAFGVCCLSEVLGQAGANVKGAAADVNKIANALEKGKAAEAKKLGAACAAKFGVNNLDKVMHQFKPRKRKGLGVGAKGQIEPDGIELKLIDIVNNPFPAGRLQTEAKALERMGYHAAAIAEVALATPPLANVGKMTKKAWLGFAKDLKNSSLALARSARAKNLAGFNRAVAKVNATCANCHTIFRKNNE